MIATPRPDLPPPPPRLLLGPLLWAAIGLLLAWSWHGTAFEVGALWASGPRLVDFFARMIPPDLSVASTVAVATIETVQIALLGTGLAAIASFALGLLGAANLTPPRVHQPVKWLLGVLRGIPLILLALIFVSVVGLGPVAGVMTIAVHATGMLGKFYAEAFENAAAGPLEALRSTGASPLQVIRFGAFRQVAPDLVRDTLFRFELNLRESLVLGLVGAGGIGFYIQLYIRAFQYDKVATLTVVVLAMVIGIEQLSVWLRRQLR